LLLQWFKLRIRPDTVRKNRRDVSIRQDGLAWHATVPPTKSTRILESSPFSIPFDLMASAKLATLFIRTLAKPISNQIKTQAKQHDSFRKACVSLAQALYRSETTLRTRLLGEPAKHIRPLSEAKAIDNGANILAEGFLFSVAAGLIIAETWRSSRSESKRREGVLDSLEELRKRLNSLEDRAGEWEVRARDVQERQEELTRVLERVVEIGIRSGFTVGVQDARPDPSDRS